MKELKILPKILNKEYLTLNGSSFVPMDRELIIEADSQEPHDSNSTIYRFKIGNGISPYKELSYVSSLYSLFPKVILCDNKYENGLTIAFNEDD